MKALRVASHPAILLVKTSSMGDVVHTLPAVSDIANNVAGVSIDWLVEENFAELPRLHPAIRRVIPVAMRRWRRSPWSLETLQEFKAFRTALYWNRYDMVIDAQGLVKSAILARFARGEHAGQGFGYAREPLAALFYNRHLAVPWALQAIKANRLLAASALQFRDPSKSPPDYGIRPGKLAADWLPADKYAVLIHAASSEKKLWQETGWVELGGNLTRRGLRCVLPWGNETEQQRAVQLAAKIPGAIVAPALNLGEAAALLAGAVLVAGVDSGLTHLAAAIGTPVIALFNGSDPARTGVVAMQDRFARNLGSEGNPPSVELVVASVEDALK
jgi:heptosyltransferase I